MSGLYFKDRATFNHINLLHKYFDFRYRGVHGQFGNTDHLG